MNIRTIRQQRAKLLFIHFLLCILTLILVEIFSLQANYHLMGVFAIYNICYFIFLLLRELKLTQGINFYIFFFIGCLLRVAFNGWILSRKAFSGYQIAYMGNQVNDYIFPTMIWMNISYMLLLFGFTKIYQNEFKSNVQSLFSKYDFLKIAIWLFICSYIISFLKVFFFSSTLQGIFSNLKYASLFLLLFNATYTSSKKHFYLLILFIILEIVNSTFYGFYKSDIAKPLLFLILYFYLRGKYYGQHIFSIKNIVIIGLTFIFLIGFIFPFITYKRQIAKFDPKEGGATIAYSNVDVISKIMSADSDMLSMDEANDRFYGRFGAISANAFYYKDVSEKHTYIPEFTIASAFLYIPRLIYPHKPNNEVGIMSSSYALTGNFGESYRRDVDFYTFIGFFSGKYVFGGICSVFVFSILTGIILAILYNYIFQHSYNPFSYVCLTSIILQAFTNFEETSDIGISLWGAMLIYYLIIRISNKFFKSRLLYRQKWIK